jgi:hypothetical protein
LASCVGPCRVSTATTARREPHRVHEVDVAARFRAPSATVAASRAPVPERAGGSLVVLRARSSSTLSRRPGRKPASSPGIPRDPPARADLATATAKAPHRAPLHRPAPQRPLPGRRRHRPFGLWRTTPEVSFRPRGFAPPRRFAPLIAPSPGLPPCPRRSAFRAGNRETSPSRCRSGFAAFPARSRARHPFPAPSPRREHPSKDSPHPQPYRVTAALPLLALSRRASSTSRRSRCRSRRSAGSARSDRLQGLAPPMGPYHPSPCADVE